MEVTGSAYIINGDEYTRVTQLTGLLTNTSALMNWVQKIAINVGGDIDQRDYASKSIWREAVKSESFRRRAAARDRGTEVHAAIELAIAGEDFPERYIQWVDRAMDFLDEFGFGDDTETELTVVNTELKYAGTVDLVSPQGIVDWKTGRYYPSHMIQLCAYMECDAYVVPGTDKLRQFMPPEKGYIVAITEEVYDEHELERDSLAYVGAVSALRALVTVDRWRKEWDK